MSDLTLPKFNKIFASGTVKLNTGLTFLLKCYILVSILLAILCHLFVVVNFTLKDNGGIVSLNYIVHHSMQFLLVFRPGHRFTTDQVFCLLNEANRRRIKLYRSIILSSTIVVIAIYILMLIACRKFRGPGTIYLLAYGFDGSSLEDSLIKRILLLVGMNNVTNIFITGLEFSARYFIFVYAISLVARQNINLMDTLLESGPMDTRPETFSCLEQLYFDYREVVGKLNASYGNVPLWFLLNLYTNITGLGTFIVIFHGKASVLDILGRSMMCVATAFAFTVFLIHLCTKSHNFMARFRRKGLELVNLQLKRSKVADSECECLANTLRAIPLTKIRAGQMYDMEYSILISLLSSAVPTAAMLVSLLREFK